MAAATAKTAAERLADVKRDLPRIEKQIDSVAAKRRAAVLAGNVTERRQRDSELRALRDDLQAAHDATAWLPQQAQREAQAQRPSEWPSDLPSARAALDGTRAARAHREAIKPIDRSARCQQEIDHYHQREHALIKLIERLRPQESAA